MRIFVTGATGWIGSALVPDLLSSGHQVVGLARSDASAEALAQAGAEAVRGTVDDLDLLAEQARATDATVHLAFKHDIAFTGDFQGAAEADRAAVDTFGDALAGTGKPLTVASGTIGLAPGKVATEEDMPQLDGSAVSVRAATSLAVLALADRGVRSSLVRLAPSCHGKGDTGFVPTLVQIARDTGVSGYLRAENRWPAAHRDDVARLFQLAVEKAPAGAVLHGTAEQGVRHIDVAETIGAQLGLPVQQVPEERAAEHFTWLAPFLGLDSPADNSATRALVGWEPKGPTLLEDIAAHYTK